MQRLTINKLKYIKYLFTLLINGTIFLIIGVDSTFIQRIVIDLMLKGLSLNQLQEHLELNYCIRLSHPQIQDIQNKAAEKARAVNHRIDLEIAPKITKIEVDEIFQGKNSIILGAIAKKWNYCVGLQWSPDRTKESIIAFLKPITRRYMNISIVITDLLSSYKEIIPFLFKKAVHLSCHIHAGRILRRKMQHLKVKLSRMKKKRELSVKANVKTHKKLQKIRDRIVFISNRLKKDGTALKQLTLIKRQKATSHSKTLDKNILKITQRIQKDKKEIKTLRKDRGLLIRDQLKQPSHNKELQKMITKAQQDLLQSGRLLKDFYKILRDLTPNYKKNKQSYIERLESSKYSLARDILKMIRDNPDLFSVRSKRVLPENYQNTNTIEGLFSLFRRLLDSTRLLSSEYGNARYCDLFRLYHNTMAPYTGPNSNKSPAERLGVKLDGKTYLDLLFPLHRRKTHFFCLTENKAPSDSFRFKRIEGVQCKILIF